MEVRRYLNSQTALWSAFALALLGSLTHTASTFALLEAPAWRWLAYLEAVAVDVALAALAYAVERRRHERRPTATLWAGVIVFALVSAWGNLVHGAAQAVGGTLSVQAVASLDPISAITVILFSLVLPVAVVYLAEILSDDHNHAEAQLQTGQPAREYKRKAKELQIPDHGLTAATLPVTVHAAPLTDDARDASANLDTKTLAQMAVVVKVHAANPAATLAEVGAALDVGLSRAGEIRRLAVQTGYLRADGKHRFVPNGRTPQMQEMQQAHDGGAQ